MDDTYYWVLTLDDGSTLDERDEGGMARVPIDRVRRLDVWVTDDADLWGDQPAFTVPLRADQTLIWFRDRRIGVRSSAIAATENGDVAGERYTYATVFGWKQTINGKTAKTYVWLMHDGRILVTDCDFRFVEG